MKAWIVTAGMVAVIQATGMAAGQSVAQSPQQARIEKGRVAVSQVCVGCHSGGGAGGIMRMLEVREKSEQEWRETVYRMIGRGAQVFPDEIEPLTAYLASSARRSRPQTPSSGGQADSILARRCGQCHDLTRATTKLASEDWPTIIDRMVGLGAVVTPAERQTLIEYLTALKK
jgi:cytochrome c2